MSIISRISATVAAIAFGLLALGAVSSTTAAADEPWGKGTFSIADEPWGTPAFSIADEPWGR